MGKFIDLTGQVFGRLTVISRVENPKNTSAQWNCLCICGKKTKVASGQLNNGDTKSCGCLYAETRKTNNLKHGMSDTLEYKIWKDMKQRCYSKTQMAKHYRDRGIKICDRWLESFENFYADMGPRPTTEYSIDRIDNDGDYCPENCRWATKTEQNNNTRKNVRLTLHNETKTIAEWSRILGLPYDLIRHRKGYGWSDEKVLTTPVKRC